MNKTATQKLVWICDQTDSHFSIEYRDDKFMVRIINNQWKRPDFMLIAVKDIQLDLEINKIALFFGLDLKTMK